MAQQKFPKAYEAYQQAVYRDGRNPTFWCSIGVLYYQINQYRDALDAYSRAIRLNPYISEVWYDLGTLVRFSLPHCEQHFNSTSTSPVTIKQQMLWMLMLGLLSWTLVTRTSKRASSCLEMAGEQVATSTMRLSHKMFIHKHTSRALEFHLALSGVSSQTKTHSSHLISHL
jgi:tetratricopeptide (TPR) repeat protein